MTALGAAASKSRVDVIELLQGISRALHRRLGERPSVARRVLPRPDPAAAAASPPPTRCRRAGQIKSAFPEVTTPSDPLTRTWEEIEPYLAGAHRKGEPDDGARNCRM